MAGPFTVAVVGAGFSGVMVTAHLLRARAVRPIRVVVINRSGTMARGVAYGTNSPNHLLNVPAGRMSAFPNDPGHFARFAVGRDAAITPATFVRRSVYGEYLGAILDDAIADAGPNRLERIIAEVATIRPSDTGVTLATTDGRTLTADRVVLAVGNYPPANPAGLPVAVTQSPFYVRDPWARGSLANVAGQTPTLLVGTGLTMLDVAIDLKSRGFCGAIAISRRGLLPQPHDPTVSPAEPSHRPANIDRLETLPELLHAIRSRVKELSAAGGNWRQVIDSLRPITPALWQRLSVAEKARFFRHLRPYWDCHRHRAAPATAAAIYEYRQAGWLTVRAARFLDARVDSDGVEVTFMPRRGTVREMQRFGAVVNCTGPAADASIANDPLLADLFAAGLARPDPLGLGLAVAGDGSVIAADGTPSPAIGYVGPLLRARDGEGTAVPELRVHAANLAERILKEIH